MVLLLWYLLLWYVVAFVVIVLRYCCATWCGVVLLLIWVNIVIISSLHVLVPLFVLCGGVVGDVVSGVVTLVMGMMDLHVIFVVFCFLFIFFVLCFSLFPFLFILVVAYPSFLFGPLLYSTMSQ